jgi:hypothetical protein
MLVYKEMSENLSSKMRECLAKGDNSLLGVVMNVLLLQCKVTDS